MNRMQTRNIYMYIMFNIQSTKCLYDVSIISYSWTIDLSTTIQIGCVFCLMFSLCFSRQQKLFHSPDTEQPFLFL